MLAEEKQNKQKHQEALSVRIKSAVAPSPRSGRGTQGISPSAPSPKRYYISDSEENVGGAPG